VSIYVRARDANVHLYTQPFHPYSTPTRPQGSGLPLNVSEGGRFYNLSRREDTRPDVTLLSHAAAYAGWYQVGATKLHWGSCAPSASFINVRWLPYCPPPLIRLRSR
jgi:hypothetical protein